MSWRIYYYYYYLPPCFQESLRADLILRGTVSRGTDSEYVRPLGETPEILTSQVRYRYTVVGQDLGIYRKLFDNSSVVETDYLRRRSKIAAAKTPISAIKGFFFKFEFKT